MEAATAPGIKKKMLDLFEFHLKRLLNGQVSKQARGLPETICTRYEFKIGYNSLMPLKQSFQAVRSFDLDRMKECVLKK